MKGKQGLEYLVETGGVQIQFSSNPDPNTVQSDTVYRAHFKKAYIKVIDTKVTTFHRQITWNQLPTFKLFIDIFYSSTRLIKQRIGAMRR